MNSPGGSSVVFDGLDCWLDPGQRDAAGQMAVDEVLLRSPVAKPLLRVYRWSEAAVTVGYFESVGLARARLNAPSIPVVRRLTGGGSVLHGRDLAYTLLVPKGMADEAFGADRANSYRVIHQALLRALRQLGVDGVELAAGGAQQVGIPCFQAPVSADLIDSRTGAKIAGAGQRRTREGLIHQGSVGSLGVKVDLEAFLIALAENLGTRVEVVDERDFGSGFQGKWQALRATRYATEEWNYDKRS